MENEDEKKSVVLESENSKFTWQSSKITRSFHSVFGNTFEEYVIFFRGLIWLIAVAFCTYFMIYQLQQCLDKLKSPPVQTQTQIKMKEYMDYPAITLCYKNKDGQGYDESLLQYFGIDGYWIRNQAGKYSDKKWAHFNFSAYSLELVWKCTTYGVQSFDRVPPADGLKCPMDMPPQGKIYIKQESLNQIPSKYQGILHEERYFHEHGQCYTVEPPNDSEKPMPGENHGYRLEFHMSQSPNTNCSMFPGGFDVYIHDREKWWGENPLMPYRGESLHITSGKETHIQIGETIYHSLSKEGEICKVDKSKDDVSYSECMEKCRWRKITHDYGCLTPFMDTGEDLPECDNFVDFEETMDRYRQWTDPVSREQCGRICTENCTMKIYRAQVAKEVENKENTVVDEDTGEIDPDKAYFYIFYPSGVSEELTEDWGYDMTLFIADFGGSLGFLLGISLLSVLEIVEGLSLSCYRLYMNWRHNRKQQKELSSAAIASDVDESSEDEFIDEKF